MIDKPEHVRIAAGCTIDEQAWIGFHEDEVPREPGAITIEIGAGSEVRPYAILRTCGGFIRIGERTVVNYFCVMHGLGGIAIGNDVLFGPGSQIYAQNHEIPPGPATIRGRANTGRGVKLGDDIWVGAGVIVTDGVTVGTGSVLAAGSVVTRDVEPYTIVAGVPAKEVRKRPYRGDAVSQDHAS